MIPIKIIIGDDDPITVAGMRNTLEQYPDIQIIAVIQQSISQIFTVLDDHDIDVIILDLSWWNDKSAGIDAIQQIKQRHYTAKIIAITAYTHLIDRAKQAGADEARSKGFTGPQLVETIRSVTRQPANLEDLLPMVETLTAQELKILTLIADGLTNKEMAYQLKISDAAVKNHVNNIFGKMNARSRAEAVAIGFKRRLL